MNAVEKDDFAHALGQTMQFYGKTLDSTQFSFWYQAFNERDLTDIKRALLQYTQSGRYAPKPIDIRELMQTASAANRAHLPSPEVNTKPCPPEVSAAWMWFLGMSLAGSKNMDGVFTEQPDMTTAQQEKYLHIVNHEARAACEPDSIPDEFKLAEVWGDYARK